jgi:hypothetical protein
MPALFKARQPRSEDRAAYQEWDRERVLGNPTPKPVKPITDYIDTIERTKYADDESLQVLVWLLNAQSHPYIGIGTYKGY